MKPTCRSQFYANYQKLKGVSEEKRQLSFDKYWSDINKEQRQVYVSSLVDVTEVRQRRSDEKNPR